jgi:hypothetical protein
MSPLTDLDHMPFGEHKGKLMQNVPVNYLHWLWTHGMSQETKPVAEYIRSNLNALKKENPDLIWD